jgi:hypothetical protein
LTRHVASVSYADDLAGEVDRLAREHGGLSKWFQTAVRASMRHRAAAGLSPSGEELVEATSEQRARDALEQERLARITRLENERLARIVRERRVKRAAERAKQEAPKPIEAIDARFLRPAPVSYEDYVREAAIDYQRFRTVKEGDENAALIARGQGYDRDEFLRAARAAAGVNGQTNLHALPATREAPE